MGRFLGTVVAFCALCVPTVHSQLDGVHFLKDSLAMGDAAVGLLPPSFVCSPIVERTVWSPNGSWLAVQRRTPKGQGQALLWNVGKETSRVAYSYQTAKARVASIYWLSDSSAVVLDIRDGIEGIPSQIILLVSVDTGVSKTLFKSQPGQAAMISVSPTKPIGVLTLLSKTDARQEFHMAVFSSRGISGNPIGKLPVEGQPLMALQSFDISGEMPVLTFMFEKSDKQGSHTRRFRLKPGSSVLEEYSSASQQAISLHTGPPSRFRIVSEPVAGLEAQHSKEAVWLEANPSTKQGRLLVTSDGHQPSLAPNDSALLYRHADGLLVRRLIAIPADVFAAGIAKELQQEAETKCKEAVRELRALLQSLSRLPSVEEWGAYASRANIDPRVRQSFVYLHSGQPWPAGTIPSAEVIGYVANRGGRALVKGDLSIVWEPSKP